MRQPDEPFPKNARLGKRVRQSENAGPYYQAGHHSYSFDIQPGHLIVWIFFFLTKSITFSTNFFGSLS